MNSINGKLFNIIKNMYSNKKSRIFNFDVFSEYFTSEIGVRQGERLSLVLFALYLNDLEKFLPNKDIAGLKSISSDIETELDMHINLFILLYADGTVRNK